MQYSVTCGRCRTVVLVTTRITDTDKDNLADRFETISDRWGFNNYHEYAFGSKFDKHGDIWEETRDQNALQPLGSSSGEPPKLPGAA